jgi:hypothetical protein
MNIIDKYNKLRGLLRDGDLVLFHGTGFIATVIKSSDKNEDGSWAYHNHIGIVVESHGALFIVDSNANGVQADRLSKRIKKYDDGGDFTIIKTTVKRELIDIEMRKLLHRSDDKWIRYDFFNGIKELLNRRFGFKLTINLSEERDICSDFVSRYACNLDLVNQKFKDKTIVFPEDYIRYVNYENANIIK